MNFTSQICTSRSQSERLLALGLKKETADCLLVENPFYDNEYVVITGRAFMAPHPHRHYTFEEFVDKLNEDPNFKNVILNK